MYTYEFPKVRSPDKSRDLTRTPRTSLSLQLPLANTLNRVQWLRMEETSGGLRLERYSHQEKVRRIGNKGLGHLWEDKRISELDSAQVTIYVDAPVARFLGLLTVSSCNQATVSGGAGPTPHVLSSDIGSNKDYGDVIQEGLLAVIHTALIIISYFCIPDALIFGTLILGKLGLPGLANCQRQQITPFKCILDQINQYRDYIPNWLL